MYLCNNISQHEWSGVLLYEVTGDLKTEKFSCAVKDIYPMDKGSTGYTEYEFDESFTTYLMQNPEAMAWHIGHVHSHNTMSTFFSPTDNSELEDNSKNHNIYLSLIVNNKLETCARIAFRGTLKKDNKQTISFTDNNGEQRVVKKTIKEEKEVMFVYDCKINFTSEVSESFKERVQTIIDEADLRVKAAQRDYNRRFPAYSYQNGWDDYGHGEIYPPYRQGMIGFDNKKKYNKNDFEKDIKELLIESLTFGNNTHKTIKTALQAAFYKYDKAKDKEKEEFLEGFIIRFLNYYNYHFPESANSSNDTQNIGAIIDMLEAEGEKINSKKLDEFVDLLEEVILTV